MNDSPIDDEKLSAYLDGELDARERERIDAALEQDPGARIRLERMRSADQRLRREVAVPRARVIDPLAEYILRVETTEAAGVRTRRNLATPLWAMAAGIVGIFLGILLVRGVQGPGEFSTGYASGELRESLDLLASGEVSRGKEKTTILLTLLRPDGRACRLFSSQGDHVGEGLACHDELGWKVMAWDGAASSDGFRTAGASPLLDSVMDAMQGTTLESAAERELLRSGWPTPRP